MELTRSNLPEYLSAARLLADTGPIRRIDPAGGRYRNFKVRLTPTTGLFVKQGRSDTESTQRLRRESRFLQILAEVPALDQVNRYAPALLLHDPANRVLVTALSSGETLSEWFHHNGYNRDCADDLANAISVLHNTDLQGIRGRFASIPPVPRIFQVALDETDSARGPRWQAIGKTLRSTPIAIAELTALRDGWSASRLIHGDLKFANILYSEPDGIQFVDWDMAGPGDSDWDFGGLVQSVLLDIFLHVQTGNGPPWEHPDWAAAERFVQRLWSRYAYLTRFNGQVESRLRRITQNAGARLLQSAYECCLDPHHDSTNVASLVDAALQLIVDPGLLARRFAGDTSSIDSGHLRDTALSRLITPLRISGGETVFYGSQQCADCGQFSQIQDPLTRHVASVLYHRVYLRRDKGYSPELTRLQFNQILAATCPASPGHTGQFLVERDASGSGEWPVERPFLVWYGKAAAPAAQQTDIDRFYFNITAEGLPLLAREISLRLDNQAIPFRLKCLADPAQFNRPDACVLYLPSCVTTDAETVVRGLHCELRRFLRAEAPLFCTQVLPGIGRARDPGGHESFGASRCRLVAMGIVQAYRDGSQDCRERMEAIAAVFAEHAIDPVGSSKATAVAT